MRYRCCSAVIVSLLALTASACSAPPRSPAPKALPPLPPGPRVSYDSDVKPVLERRCVVCHGCYDAPCQLLLSSYEGVTRGASKQAVYDASRLEPQAPTRLFLDAPDTAAWRRRGFFAVVGEPATVPADGLEPLLERMIVHGYGHPFPADAKLPDAVALDIQRPLNCPLREEFPNYAAENPWGGMPYGMAPLSEEEFKVLGRWLSEGAPGPQPPPPLPATLAAQVRAVETFLNGSSNKERLTARYLYEHLFLAHLYFEGTTGPSFELVRSRTAPGSPVDVIATVRPYDDPGSAPFYYRLRPVRGTILHKTHIVYSIGAKRLARWRQLFLDSDWDVADLPTYQREVAANPFLSFTAIPARSRYLFLLDDAQYTIMTFIRGPVCRGQIAVDVIEDRFWVAFLDPDWDLSVTDPSYLPATAADLVLPAEDAGNYEVGDLWLKGWKNRSRYVHFRDRRYQASDPQGLGMPLDAIWDGDGSNPNALLTVFRHFDSAEVERGFIGAVPKTAWVIDYPLLERIYYDLVAGFNIFGAVAHQVSTRLYMDYLRMESEDLFLSFLPREARQPLRESWYRGLMAHLTLFVSGREPGWERGTRVQFLSGDPKAEILLALLERGAGLWPRLDSINRCAAPPCERPGASTATILVDAQLQAIAARRGPFVRLLPEVSLLRVDDTGGEDLVYSLIHDRAHSSVAFMFGEDKRLMPEDDTLTIVPGHAGSYPNFFFTTTSRELPDSIGDLRVVNDEASFAHFVARWGVRRTSRRFWSTFDWLQADLAAREPLQAGLLDLNRYVDP